MFFCDQEVGWLVRFVSFQSSQPLVSTRRITPPQDGQTGFVPNIPIVRTVLLCGVSLVVGMTGMSRDNTVGPPSPERRTIPVPASGSSRPACYSTLCRERLTARRQMTHHRWLIRGMPDQAPPARDKRPARDTALDPTLPVADEDEDLKAPAGLKVLARNGGG
jgi:hypothetical protein